MSWRKRGVGALTAGVLTLFLSACGGAVDDPEVADPPPDSTGASPDSGAEAGSDPSEAAVESGEASADDEDPSTDESPVEEDASASQEWQTVEYGWSSFNLPASWDVQYEQVDGQEVPRPAYGRGFCETDPEELLGSVVITWAEGVSDPGEAVTAEIEPALDHFFGDRIAEHEVGEVRQDGAWASVPTTIQLSPSEDPCDGDEALVVVKGAAYEDGSGTVLFIVVGELGVPQSPTPEELIEIANSFE